jgi:hypothetical protein
MKRLATVLVAAAVTMTTADASAAEEAPPSDYEQLKGLECFVGNWLGKGKVPEGAERWAGEDITVPVSVKWALNKNALTVSWKVEIRGKVAGRGRGFWYWDPSTKQIKSWALNSVGGHGQAIWTTQASGWMWKQTGVEQDGRKTSMTTTVTVVTEDTHLHKWQDYMIGGKPQPDQEIEYKRVKPKKQ